jgi:acyl dehydratase
MAQRGVDRPRRRTTHMEPYTLDLTAFAGLRGKELAVSPWVSISQKRIDAFAEAVDDRQWIFTDPLRAAAESPFEGTIAHGFLVLSLISSMLRQSVHINGTRMAINYGLDRVRFMAPVHAGASIRTRFTVGDVEEKPAYVRVTWTVVVERQHEDKPCCVADWVTRYYR